MTRHSLIWLILIIGIFLFSPLVVTPTEYTASIDREIQSAQRWYGDEEFLAVEESSKAIYGLLMVKTGIDGLLRKHFTKPTAGDELAPGYKLPAHLATYTKQVDGYWKGLLDNMYLFCLRLAQARLWLYYMFPFLLASVFDGVMNRKAKIASFRYTSPTLYNASWHIIIFLVAASLVCFSVTFSITALSYPAVITIIGLLVRLLISNVQHSA